MSEFDAALALTEGPGGSSGAMLTSDWTIGEAVNGGLLMALTAKALGEAIDGASEGGHVDPLAYSAYFLSPSAPGPATVDTEVLRSGRTMSTGSVRLLQDGVERVRALASFGDLATRSEPVLRSAAPPAIAPIEQCLSSADAPREVSVALMDRLDLRLDPASAMWAVGQPSGQGRINGWVRFADQRPIDPLALLFFLDALPPVAFDLGIMGWAPTIEFSAHLRRVPVDGWLQVQLSTDTVAGGLLDEDAKVWDASGALVAQSRQLAGVRMPTEPVTGQGNSAPSGAQAVGE